MDFGVTGVAAITVLTYGVGLLVKASGLADKWVPVICALTGMVLGVAGMLLMPSMPADDYITAAAIGMVSGLAATGADQAIRRLASGKNNSASTSNTSTGNTSTGNTSNTSTGTGSTGSTGSTGTGSSGEVGKDA